MQKKKTTVLPQTVSFQTRVIETESERERTQVRTKKVGNKKRQNIVMYTNDGSVILQHNSRLHLLESHTDDYSLLYQFGT